MISEVIEEPTGKQCRKLLCEEKAVPPSKTACKAACKHMPTHTMWPDCSIWPPWCSEAPEQPQYPLGTMLVIFDDQYHPRCYC